MDLNNRKNPLDLPLMMFDMGNVVVKNITTIEKIAAFYHLPLHEFSEDYHKYEFPLMDGAITSDVYWKHVAIRFGVSVEEDPLAIFFKPEWNPTIVGCIDTLRLHGKRIICASNTYAPHWKILADNGFLSIFDATYASHELGVTKPSRQFFERILEQEHRKPSEACFVDDYLENVQAAEQLGIRAFHYADKDGVAADERLSAFFGC